MEACVYAMSKSGETPRSMYDLFLHHDHLFSESQARALISYYPPLTFDRAFMSFVPVMIRIGACACQFFRRKSLCWKAIKLALAVSQTSTPNKVACSRSQNP